MTVDDLIAFINARLDEDEAIAQAATPGPWVTIVRITNNEGVITDMTYPAGNGYVSTQPVMSNDEDHHRANEQHIARHDPARALREVAAKRAIVARYEHLRKPRTLAERAIFPALAQAVLGCLQDAAAVWSDHPDYQAGWATA